MFLKKGDKYYRLIKKGGQEVNPPVVEEELQILTHFTLPTDQTSFRIEVVSEEEFNNIIDYTPVGDGKLVLEQEVE